MLAFQMVIQFDPTTCGSLIGLCSLTSDPFISINGGAEGEHHETFIAENRETTVLCSFSLEVVNSTAKISDNL